MFIQAFCSSFNHIFGFFFPHFIWPYIWRRTDVQLLGQGLRGRGGQTPPAGRQPEKCSRDVHGLPGPVRLSCVLSHLSHCVRLFVTPWTVTRQAPLSMGFSRQEYWSGLPCPPPGCLPNPGSEPWSPALQADSLSLSHQGSPLDFSGSSQSWCSVLFLLLGFQVQQTQWMEKGTD